MASGAGQASGRADPDLAAVQLVQGRQLTDWFTLCFGLQRSRTATASLYLHWADVRNHLALEFGPAGLVLNRVRDGVRQRLGEARWPTGGELAGEGPHPFQLKRRPRSLSLFLRKVELLHLEWPAPAEVPPGGGLFGVWAGQGAAFSGLKYQAQEALLDRDGFTRRPGEGDPWEVRHGRFEIARQLDPAKSASPFYFVAEPRAEGGALATHGQWFWEHYEARVSLRLGVVDPSGATVSSLSECLGPRGGCQASGVVEGAWAQTLGAEAYAALERLPADFGMGLAFYLESAESYRLLRVRASPEPVLELVVVEAGREQVVASRGLKGGLGQWLNLRVLVKGSAVRCYVDEVFAFSRRLPGLVSGAVGLVVNGRGDPRLQPQFDDLAVTGIEQFSEAQLLAAEEAPELRQFLRLLDPAVGWVPEYFAQQETMLKWANPKSTFVAQGAYAWHANTLFNDALLSWRAPAAPLKAGTLSAAFCAPLRAVSGGPEPDSEGGYRILVEVKGPAELQISAFRQGNRLGTQALPFDGAVGVGELDLGWRAGALWVQRNGREVARFQDPGAPFLSGRVGVALDGKPVDPATLQVRSTFLADETFASAPAGWRPESGRWEMTSRWACSPQFTWFGGKGVGSGRALLWGRQKREGDQELDVFVSQSMFARKPPYYDAPLNIGLAFCTDGASLSSGYLFHFGFYDQPTVLYRRGRQVARCADLIRADLREQADALTNIIHRHWFQLRVVYVGGRIEGFVDGRQVFAYEDPQPLAGGQVALVTSGPNGLMVARVRHSFERGGAGASPFVEASSDLAAGPGASAGALGAAEAAGRGTVGTAPVVQVGGVARVVVEAGRWKGLGADPSGLAVRLRRAPGGADPGDAVEVENLRSGGGFSIAAEGLAADLHRTPFLAFRYRIEPGVRIHLYARFQDRLWRIGLNGPQEQTPHASPLCQLDGVQADGSWQQALVPLREALWGAVPALQAQEGPLLVEGLVFGNCEEDLELEWGLAGNRCGGRYAVAGVSFLGEAAARGKLELQVAGEEDTRFRVSWLAGSGGGRDSSRERHFKRKTSLDPGGREGLAWLVLQREEIRGRAVQEPSYLQAVLLGEARPANPAGPGAGPLGLSPGLPELRLPAEPWIACDFEEGLGPLRSMGGVEGGLLFLERLKEPCAARGARVLRVAASEPGVTLGTYLCRGPFDLRKYGLLSFDLQADPGLGTQLGLLLRTRRGLLEIPLNDPTGGWPRLTGQPRFTANGQWQRVGVDLLAALEGAQKDLADTDFLVHELAIGDWGRSSATSLSTFRMDNLRLDPVLGVGAEVKVAPARGGAGGCLVAWDQIAETQPQPAQRMGVQELLGAGWQVTKPGAWYLHLRWLDGEGNAGPLHHRMVLCRSFADQDPPKVSDPQPAPGARCCPAVVSVKIQDVGSGLDFHRSWFEVNGRRYGLGEGRLSYQREEDRLQLRLADAGEGPRFEAGGKVAVVVRAADLAGNALREPFGWEFIFDPSSLRAAPEPPTEVGHLPAERLVFERFEGECGGVRDWLGSLPISGSAGGRGVLELYRRFNQNPSDTLLIARPFDAGRYPILRFDLKLLQPMALDLIWGQNNGGPAVRLTGEHVEVQGAGAPKPAALPVGEWITVRIDARRHIPALKQAGRMPCSYLMLRCHEKAVGSAVLLDNLVLHAPSGRAPEFFWSAPADPSGIVGYASSFDQDPQGQPQPRVNTQGNRAVFPDAAPGIWYLHLSAVNGAGLWSPARHVRVVFE